MTFLDFLGGVFVLGGVASCAVAFTAESGMTAGILLVAGLLAIGVGIGMIW